MTETPNNQAPVKHENVRCSASVMRGQRCSRFVADTGTLCASHLAMGWSSRDEFTDSRQPTRLAR